MSQVASAESPRGTVTLTRRRGRQGQPVLELRVNGVFVMDDEETSSERALARAAVDALDRGALRVLVGGLGLGFTLQELQRDRRVTEIVVAEIEEAVVAWHRAGVIPHGPDLVSGPGTSVVAEDVAAVIATSHDLDLILLDVDNGPLYLVHEQNAALYRDDFLRSAAQALAPGGALCVWAANEADDLEHSMRRVFGDVRRLRYPVRLQTRDEHYLLYLSRLVSRA